MNFRNYLHTNFIVQSVIVIYYLVGIVTILIDPSLEILRLTPLTMILSFIALLSGTSEWSVKRVTIFSLIFLLSFIIEAVGVNTGWPFGSYLYSSTLGWQVYNTPIIIGVNWLLLLWAIHDSLKRFITNNILLIICSALGMVAMDILIEPIAIKFNFWNWSNNIIPLSNYIAWFLISLVLSLLLNFANRDRIPAKNSVLILSLQFIFFLTFTLC